MRLRNSSTVPRGCSIRPMIAAVSLLPVPGLDGVPQPYPTAVCAGGNGGPGPAACGVRRRRGGVSWLRCLEAPRPGRNRAVRWTVHSRALWSGSTVARWLSVRVHQVWPTRVVPPVVFGASEGEDTCAQTVSAASPVAEIAQSISNTEVASPG